MKTLRLERIASVVLLSWLAFLCLPAAGQTLPVVPTASTSRVSTEMSPEEKVVRLAYRKLAIYENAGRRYEAERNEKPVGSALAEKVLKFELRDFRVGGIDEIRERLYADMVTPPTGNIIQIGGGTDVGEREDRFSVEGRWTRGQYASGVDRDWTIGEVLRLEPAWHDVRRYASYEVTATFEGTSRTYRALTLFHNPNQENESLTPQFLDSVVGMAGTVTRVFQENKLPLGTNLRNGVELPHTEGQDRQNRDYGKQTSIPVKALKDFTSNLLSQCDGGFFIGAQCGSCIDWFYSPISGVNCLIWSVPPDGGGE